METAAVLAVFGMLAGCSGSDGKKAYDVPTKLCGVTVDPSLVLPFLPSGEKVRVRGADPVPSRRLCQMDIDGKWALMANQEWWAKDVSIATVVGANPQLVSAKTSTDGALVYGGNGAVERVESCKNPSHPRWVLYTSLRVRASSLGDAYAMKKLATAYSRAVAKTHACS
ncbi:hypothetical protein [Streptomyces bungoensis]|uniref:hypothetical protein n=1 Tax=Streptomyces bungoensis TaxID=285568 RepID=UPI0033CD3D8C